MKKQHYITICFKNSTEVTYTKTNDIIAVIFKQLLKVKLNRGFNKLVLDINGCIIKEIEEISSYYC